jgi:hypothetical protein
MKETPMLIVSLVGIVFIVAVVNVCVVAANNYRVAATASFVFLLLSMVTCAIGLLFPPVSITAVLLLLISLICGESQIRVKNFRIATVCAAVVGILAGFGFSLPYVTQMHRLQEEFPMLSLAPRLAYETKHPQQRTGVTTVASKTLFAPPPPGTPAWDHLAAVERETKSGRGRREWALERIHSTTVEQFISAPGFGIGRMPYVGDYWRQTRRHPPIPLRTPVDDSSPQVPSGPLHITTGRRAGDGLQSRLGLNDQLSDLHQEGLRDFLDPESFGWIVDRDHVAGFESHQFSDQFQAGRLQRGTDEGRAFELTRLELISLLKFDTPRAYVSNQNLPQIEQLADAATRPLTPFESAALALLEKGDDLAFTEQGRHVFAFGALRAHQQCMKCHDVERGTLLGAFSYQILREDAVEKQRNPPAQKPELHRLRPNPPT